MYQTKKRFLYRSIFNQRRLLVLKIKSVRKKKFCFSSFNFIVRFSQFVCFCYSKPGNYRLSNCFDFYTNTQGLVIKAGDSICFFFLLFFFVVVATCYDWYKLDMRWNFLSKVMFILILTWVNKSSMKFLYKMSASSRFLHDFFFFLQNRQNLIRNRWRVVDRFMQAGWKLLRSIVVKPKKKKVIREKKEKIDNIFGFRFQKEHRGRRPSPNDLFVV